MQHTIDEQAASEVTRSRYGSMQSTTYLSLSHANINNVLDGACVEIFN
jgi:hypothetical protein